MNRKELSQIIMGTVKSNSSKEEMINHLNISFNKLKFAMDNDISHVILDKKANVQCFNVEFDNDLSSTIDSIVIGDFYTALTHLDDLVLRHYKYDEQVTPFEMYICNSILSSMIKTLMKVTQSISDFLPADIKGIYTGLKEDAAPTILEDYDKSTTSDNYLIMGKAGTGMGFSVKHGEVSEDALKKFNNNKNG